LEAISSWYRAYFFSFHLLFLQALLRYKMLVLEEQRYIHEDLERLEQGIADRIREDPKHVSSSNLWLHYFRR
jgi:hypothetical protein